VSNETTRNELIAELEADGESYFSGDSGTTSSTSRSPSSPSLPASSRRSWPVRTRRASRMGHRSRGGHPRGGSLAAAHRRHPGAF